MASALSLASLRIAESALAASIAAIAARATVAACVTVFTVAAAAATPHAGAALLALSRAGSPDNTGDARDMLVRRILPDLRVFVDMLPGDMPRSRENVPMPPAEVREAVALGLLNWASVLPGMKVRLVDSAAEASLVVRFRDYGTRIPGTAVAFLPSQWRLPPGDSGGADFSCGAKEVNKDSAGDWCYEGGNNIILFQSRSMAFSRVHFLGARMHHEYVRARSDRRDPAKRFFRLLPDARYQAWPPDRSTCIAGAPVGGKLPAWDVQCLTDSDWAALPHFRSFGAVEGSYDLASLVQHEFGHTLLGGHTGEAGRCHLLEGDAYEDLSRDPVYLDDYLRRISWDEAPPGRGRASSYSCMFRGNGLDAAFNIRGVFEADAMRLRSGALDAACRPTGAWGGYAVTYPAARGYIVLGRPGGETKYVDDWRYAQRLMGWPQGAGAGPAAGGWFQIGFIPREGKAAERP